MPKITRDTPPSIEMMREWITTLRDMRQFVMSRGDITDRGQMVLTMQQMRTYAERLEGLDELVEVATNISEEMRIKHEAFARAQKSPGAKRK